MRLTLLVVGSMYVLLGLGALPLTDGRPHFLYFVVMGLLLVFGAALWSANGERDTALRAHDSGSCGRATRGSRRDGGLDGLRS